MMSDCKHNYDPFWCYACKDERIAQLEADNAALKRIVDTAKEWDRAHPDPNGHCDASDLRGCVTARALKDALLAGQVT